MAISLENICRNNNNSWLLYSACASQHIVIILIAGFYLYFPLHRSAQSALHLVIGNENTHILYSLGCIPARQLYTGAHMLNPTTILGSASYRIPTYTPVWKGANVD